MRRRVYELNKVTAGDIPGRGPFYTFEEYEQQRFGHAGYRAEGMFLALKGAEWVGLSQVSLHEQLAFNEMTGVLRQYRGQQIAQALKLLAIRYAKAQGRPRISTFNDAANLPILTINRKLGYQPDPMLASLSAYRRSKRPVNISSSVAWINQWTNPRDLRKVPCGYAGLYILYVGIKLGENGALHLAAR